MRAFVAAALAFLFATAALGPAVRAQDNSAVATTFTDPPPTHYRWGLLTTIMVPQPIAVGAIVEPSYNPDLAFFLEGGYFSLSVGKNRTIKDWSAMGGVRYRPWSDWVVFGLSFGYRNIGANIDISSLQTEGAPLASKAILNLNTFFFGLFVGGQWNLSPNVVFGVDLGLQLAALSWGNATILPDPNSTDNTDLSVDDDEPLRRMAGLPLPQIALVRFIWYL